MTDPDDHPYMHMSHDQIVEIENKTKDALMGILKALPQGGPVYALFMQAAIVTAFEGRPIGDGMVDLAIVMSQIAQEHERQTGEHASVFLMHIITTANSMVLSEKNSEAMANLEPGSDLLQ